MRGAHFPDVEEGDIKGWGIKPFDDKKALMHHIRNLVEQNGNNSVAKAAPKVLEGAPTEFM